MVDKVTWQAAVLSYWTGLDLQAGKQGLATGKKDAGNRAAVTGGKQMDAFQDAVAAIWRSDPEIKLDVRSTGSLNLPAYYRAAKNWDLLVTYRGMLVAAMEFKSHRGPSFSNNFNNRTEEALGLAADSRAAVENGLFGNLKPWFGYVMLVERAPKSTSPVDVPRNMPFKSDPIFDGASYIKRYEIFFRRMVREQQYDAVALVTAEAGLGEYTEPAADLSLANLEAAIKGRIAFVKSLPDEVLLAEVEGLDGPA